MDDMPRPRPPNLLREITRHGKVVWYVRKGNGPRIRIKGDFGSPSFNADYQAALHGQEQDQPARAGSGTLSWLVARYRETTAWLDLSLATRRQRENIFRHILAAVGMEPFASIDRRHIVSSRDRRASTPAQARNFLDAMRGLFRWALEAGHVTIDPTVDVKNPKRRKGGGFPVWTEDEISAYQSHWPLGTRERVWFDVLLYTGLRRGDVVRLGRQHVHEDVATIITEKGGYTVEVTIPILPILAQTLEAGPCGDLAFIAGVYGRPFKKESFAEAFRVACRAAGIMKSPHGLRKSGATRAANNGATVAELEAIFGWQGGGMAALYTRSADRRRLSKGAVGKLVRNDG